MTAIRNKSGNGGELQEFRKSLGLTQQEAAKRMGIGREHLSRFENARSLPSLWNFMQMRKAYGQANPDKLFAAFEAVWKRKRRRNGKGSR